MTAPESSSAEQPENVPIPDYEHFKRWCEAAKTNPLLIEEYCDRLLTRCQEDARIYICALLKKELAEVRTIKTEQSFKELVDRVARTIVRLEMLMATKTPLPVEPTSNIPHLREVASGAWANLKARFKSLIFWPKDRTTLQD